MMKEKRNYDLQERVIEFAIWPPPDKHCVQRCLISDGQNVTQKEIREPRFADP